MRVGTFATLPAIWLAACSGPAEQETATLYRNSPMSYSTRVHWSTFDAVDRDGFNLSNCLMAAGLLNANLNAAAKAEGLQRDERLGFWCEPGNYAEHGEVPYSFSAQFPWK